MNAITKAAIEACAEVGTLRGSAEVKALAALIEAAHPGAIDRARARRLRARFDAKFGNPPPWVKTYVEKHTIRALRWHRSRGHSDTFYDAFYGLLVAERLYRAALAIGWTKPHSLRRAASRARAAA